jgi:hypothetical protein
VLARLEKSPLWGLHAYIHYVILALSLLNIGRILEGIPYFYYNEGFSLALSLLGIFIFILELKKVESAKYLMILWVAPQFFEYIEQSIYSSHIRLQYNLSQGFSIPLGYEMNAHFIGYSSTPDIFSVNIVALMIFAVILFKFKNPVLGKELRVRSLDVEKKLDFKTAVTKIFRTEDGQKFFILDKIIGDETWVLYLLKTQKIDPRVYGKAYDLCAVDSELTRKKEIKASSFRKISSVYITFEKGKRSPINDAVIDDPI